jgi:antitoxin FitA
MLAALVFCMQEQHNAAMAKSITIRDVPDETAAELAARAAVTGRSLQEYLRARLIELATTPEAEVLMTRIRDRKAATQSKLSVKRILAHRDADRR